MIFVKLTNGFGNNLFQYIAGRLLAEHHHKKLILIPPFKDYYALNDIEQLNLFYDDICYDIDGNIYETVQIDGQLWMAENLKVTHYNNGDEIPNITNNSSWLSIFTGAYGDYDNNPANSETYGRLYNWYTVDDDRGVCPDGWHVPSDEAYTILIDYLGGTSVAGGKMKGTGLDHWHSPNAGATNESGFTGLPSGFRYWADGNYYYMGEYNYFWTSSEGFEPPYAPFRTLRYDNTWVYGQDYAKQHGFSIRCLKD